MPSAPYLDLPSRGTLFALDLDALRASASIAAYGTDAHCWVASRQLVYTWVSGSTDADDGGDGSFVVRPTVVGPGDPGRWVALGALAEVAPGTIGDGIEDDIAAINSALERAYAGTGPRVVRLRRGDYKISSPILMLKDLGGGDVEFAGVELVGENVPFGIGGGRDTRILSTSLDTPAIIIQGARGVAVRNLCIVGPAVWTYDGTRLYDDLIYDTLFDGSLNGSPHNCRPNPYSPQAGIVVDPFIAGNPGGSAGNRYPGLEARYAGIPRKSSSILFENVIVRDCVAGFIVSPTGETGNAENIRWIACSAETTTVGFAICNTQTRGHTMVGCTVADAKYGVSTRWCPDASGANPRIEGISMGGCRHPFDISTGPQDFEATGVYVESSITIGRFGTNNNSANSPATIVGGTFSLWSSATTAAARDLGAHVVSCCPVRFSGCSFAPAYNVDGTQEVMHFYNPFGTLSFDSCMFAAEYTSAGVAAGKENQLLVTFFDESRVAMRACKVIDASVTGGQHQLGDEVIAALESELDRTRVWGRVRLDTAAEKASTSLKSGTYLESIPRWQVFAYGTATVSASGSNEATFTAPDAGLVRPGDPVFKATQNVPIGIDPQDGAVGESELSGTFVGVVESVVAGVVTLYRLPKDLVLPFTDALSTKQLPRYHKASTGTITGGGAATVTAVTNPTTWQAGDRMLDTGGNITPGVYVVSVVSTTVTLSKNITPAVAGAVLFEAPLKTFCAVASDYYGVGAGSESAMTTEQLRINKTALATTPAGGVQLTNPTDATGGAVQQVSPPLTWVGTAWDANDNVTRYVRQQAYIAPQSANAPYPILTFRESVDAGTPSWTIRHELIGGAAPEYHMSGLRMLAFDGSNLYVGGSGVPGAEYLWAGSIVFFPGSTDVGGLSTLGLTSKKALFNTGAISPAALASGTTNNYSPTGLATCSTMYITADVAGSALSGLAAQPDGFELDIYVDGTGVLTLKNLDGGSTASSQFTCPGGVDYVVAKPGGVHLKYRAGSVNKWLVRA